MSVFCERVFSPVDVRAKYGVLTPRVVRSKY